jgi:hypothetical protein
MNLRPQRTPVLRVEALGQLWAGHLMSLSLSYPVFKPYQALQLGVMATGPKQLQ